MASSTRFFSRKRFARSRCLLTSAAIPEVAFVVCGPIEPQNGLRSDASGPKTTIYRGRDAGNDAMRERCSIRQGLRHGAIYGTLNDSTAMFGAASSWGKQSCRLQI